MKRRPSAVERRRLQCGDALEEPVADAAVYVHRVEVGGCEEEELWNGGAERRLNAGSSREVEQREELE